jgi:hypothetical protein
MSENGNLSPLIGWVVRAFGRITSLRAGWNRNRHAAKPSPLYFMVLKLEMLLMDILKITPVKSVEKIAAGCLSNLALMIYIFLRGFCQETML